MDKDENNLVVTLNETEWDELCERGKLHCANCKEQPLIEEAEIFIAEGICADCANFERKLWAD
jgi:late competence protein required for DNA uptake (superfamily II DNA/RNA helicase)